MEQVTNDYNFEIIIPFCNGPLQFRKKLIESIPLEIPILWVDDLSTIPLDQEGINSRPNSRIIRLENKGYFAGAVNRGFRETTKDVLILNQDVYFEKDSWLRIIFENRETYGIFGDGVFNHPAWPSGYVQGTFMWVGRRVIDKIGYLNEKHWPLWGGTCEYQTRAVWAGFKALPMKIPGMFHFREDRPFGRSIHKLLQEEPERRDLYIRTPPLVSIIVPCYNYGKYLLDCVHSLVGGGTSLGDFPPQSIGASFEIIIVDDASRDSTQEIGKSLADSWKGIRYYRLERNVGTAKALNFGISKAFGKYITFLSADDMRETSSLERLLDACESNSHSFSYDDVYLFGQGKRIQEWRLPEYDFDLLLRKNHVHAGIMYPKAAWAEAGGYPSIMDDGREDWAFNIALGVKGYCGVHVKEVGYLYRREGQNRSLDNTSPEHNQYFLGKLRTVFPSIYQGEYPMSCCGKKGASSVVASNRSRSSQVDGGAARFASPAFGEQGMVRIRYLGKKMGASTWVGISTRTVYRFGGTRQEGWIDARDLGKRGDDGFLNMKEHGEFVFVQAQETKAKEERKEEPLAPNPNELTLEKIMELDLTLAGWGDLSDMEQEGKKRKTVLAWAKKKAHELDVEPVA